MNRKAKNIIFWTVIGVLGFIFFVTFGFGCVKTIAGVGSEAYNNASEFITNLGLNKSDFFKWSPFVCIGCGILASFLFYKKYNTRIN